MSLETHQWKFLDKIRDYQWQNWRAVFLKMYSSKIWKHFKTRFKIEFKCWVCFLLAVIIKKQNKCFNEQCLMTFKCIISPLLSVSQINAKYNSKTKCKQKCTLQRKDSFRLIFLILCQLLVNLVVWGVLLSHSKLEGDCDTQQNADNCQRQTRSKSWVIPSLGWQPYVLLEPPCSIFEDHNYIPEYQIKVCFHYIAFSLRLDRCI